jgi:hypothetical protein
MKQMKKMILALAAGTVFIACDNAADGTNRTKDSLDSIANVRKDRIDSTAEQRKDAIDSVTQRQQDVLNRADSLNRQRDTIAR